MGWAMPSYETAQGGNTLRRFTLHSLRDRFATTAITNGDAYKEEQVSWTDAETVRRYHAGTTDAIIPAFGHSTDCRGGQVGVRRNRELIYRWGHRLTQEVNGTCRWALTVNRSVGHVYS